MESLLPAYYCALEARWWSASSFLEMDFAFVGSIRLALSCDCVDALGEGERIGTFGASLHAEVHQVKIKLDVNTTTQQHSCST